MATGTYIQRLANEIVVVAQVVMAHAHVPQIDHGLEELGRDLADLGLVEEGLLLADHAVAAARVVSLVVLRGEHVVHAGVAVERGAHHDGGEGLVRVDGVDLGEPVTLA